MLALRKRRLAVTFAVVTCLSALAACNANPTPAPLPSGSPSPTTSASPSPTVAPPTLPAEAKGTSAAAAKAFVRHYIDVINFAMATGNVEQLEEFSDGSCETCLANSDRTREIYSDGGYIKNSGWRVKTVTPVPGQPRKRPILSLGVVLPAETARNSADSEIKTSAASQGNIDLRLRATTSGWLVTRMDAVQ